MKNISNFVYATIPDGQERQLIFKYLWDHFGMWDATFIISEAGEIKPNVQWFKERGVHKPAFYELLNGFFHGWRAAKAAYRIQ